MIVIIIILLSLLFRIGIAALIGVFVYQDAVKRNMNAVLWVLIAVFVPSFIGLIIYLIVRTDYKKTLNCSFCGYPVQRDYVRCPQCGAVLRNDFTQNSNSAK